MLSACGGVQDSAVPQPKHIAYISAVGDEGALKHLVATDPSNYTSIGLYRQLPAQHPILPPSNRIARVDGSVLAARSAHGIASRLVSAIDGSCTRTVPCRSGLVAIDDIASEFAGKAGANLLAAMQNLQGQESPRGGSYADRVIMYLDFDMLSDLGNPDHAAEWKDAIAAAALGNSMWLEMYDSTGVGTMNMVSLAQWEEIPRDATVSLTAAGASESQIHLMIGPWVGRVRGQTARDCRDTLTCVWHAASATPLNQQLLQNGVGMYRYTKEQLTAFCVFIDTQDPGAEPDPRVRDDCASRLTRKRVPRAPGSADPLNWVGMG